MMREIIQRRKELEVFSKKTIKNERRVKKKEVIQQ